jgi:hypothetical protein
MKIKFTEHRHLDALSRTVTPGDTLESPTDAPADLLQAYVDNGVAEITTGEERTND